MYPESLADNRQYHFSRLLGLCAAVSLSILLTANSGKSCLTDSTATDYQTLNTHR